MALKNGPAGGNRGGVKSGAAAYRHEGEGKHTLCEPARLGAAIFSGGKCGVPGISRFFCKKRLAMGRRYLYNALVPAAKR